jgi:hypothetical protein
MEQGAYGRQRMIGFLKQSRQKAHGIRTHVLPVCWLHLRISFVGVLPHLRALIVGLVSVGTITSLFKTASSSEQLVSGISEPSTTEAPAQIMQWAAAVSLAGCWLRRSQAFGL